MKDQDLINRIHNKRIIALRIEQNGEDEDLLFEIKFEDQTVLMVEEDGGALAITYVVSKDGWVFPEDTKER